MLEAYLDALRVQLNGFVAIGDNFVELVELEASGGAYE